MLLLIFGAVVYSNAMMEDLEYKNYYLQIQKGSFRKYIWSKVITAFISAVIVMVLGTSIFCLMAHFKMPLLSPDNDMLEYLAEGDYLSQLITPETIFWYLIAQTAAETMNSSGTPHRVRRTEFPCRKAVTARRT